MSVKAGESFEHAVTLILKSAGFVVERQPYVIRAASETIGDIDILLRDPITKQLIGVSCKDWTDSTPHTKDLHHFISLLEREEIKYGIMAWTNIPPGAYPIAAETASRKRIFLAFIDSRKYRELLNLSYHGKDEEIERFIRESLGLSQEEVVFSTEARSALKTSPPISTGKRIHCKNVIPIHTMLRPPEYIKNASFYHERATLQLYPYLVFHYHLYSEARAPKTREVLDYVDVEDVVVIDGLNEKVLNKEDPTFQSVRRHYKSAFYSLEVVEEQFVVQQPTPRVNKKAIGDRIKIQVAQENSFNVSYERSDDTEISYVHSPSPYEVREIYNDFVHLPIWQVTYHLGSNIYNRKFLAIDNVVLEDDMDTCLLCKKRQTEIACTACGTVACEKHSGKCSKCENLFCNNCLIVCSRCSTTFCNPHADGDYCKICSSFVCVPCTVKCSVCQQVVCQKHEKTCVQCERKLCPEHVIHARYLMLKKHFCSNKCKETYELDYKQRGIFSKIRKSVLE